MCRTVGGGTSLGARKLWERQKHKIRQCEAIGKLSSSADPRQDSSPPRACPRWPASARAGIKTAIRACAADADCYGSFPPPDGSFRPRSIINEIRRFELFTDGRSAQVALNKPDLIIEPVALDPALAGRLSKLVPRCRTTRVSWESARMRADCG